MSSTKRYTNVNFTKRVDQNDVHQSNKPRSEPAMCGECKAIHIKGRWTFDQEVLNADDPFEQVVTRETICPACRQIKSGEPSGFVFLDGEFFDQHKEEIENLLRNETEKASQVNPLARIMRWQLANHRLIVATTTEHLAKRLGRSLKRAYRGEVRYDFSHENKLARVYWHRD